MSRRYKGNNKLKYLPKNSPTSILVRINVWELNCFQKYLEGFENLTIVIPFDPKNGLLLLHTTFDLLRELLKILDTLPIEVKLINNQRRC